GWRGGGGRGGVRGGGGRGGEGVGPGSRRFAVVPRAAVGGREPWAGTNAPHRAPRRLSSREPDPVAGGLEALAPPGRECERAAACPRLVCRCASARAGPPPDNRDGPLGPALPDYRKSIDYE